MADVAASVRAPRRARGPRHRICRPWVPSSTLIPESLPGAINALHVPQMRRTGLRQASLRHMAAGGTRFKSSSRGLPPRSPDSTPVCAISMSSISSSGLPEAPLESRSWPAPVSRHRNFRRSATGGTSPGLSPGGDTPVIVLTRACGRVAPVTRGSDALVHVFPGGARTRRTGPMTPRSRDAPTWIRSADRQPPRTEFHALSLAQT